MNVLIIEDEFHAVTRLSRLLRSIRPDYRIVHSVDSVRESVEWLEENGLPELIFMDIQLSDGLSFSIFNKIEILTPVIFTTAFNEYSLRAFKVNSVDYLLKPIDETELSQAIQKFEQLNEARNVDSLKSLGSIMKDFVAKESYKERFLIRHRDQFLFLLSGDIAYFYSEDSVTFIMTQDGRRFIFDRTLNQLEGDLDPRQFFRINRRQIIHHSSIVKIHTHFNSRLKIDLVPEFDQDALVSREKVKEFKLWLGG